MTTQTITPAARRPLDSRLSTVLQAVLAIGAGLSILWLVGFSHIEVVHNAAHDTRHANGFPCH